MISALAARSCWLSDAFAVRAAPFLAAGVLDAADIHAVALLAGRYGDSDPERLLGLAMALRAPRAGHTGVVLSEVDRHVANERIGRDEAAALPWPKDLGAWERTTLTSPLVGASGDRRPLVRQDLGGGATLLLTRKMDVAQRALADALVARARQAPAPAVDDVPTVEAALSRLYCAAVASPAAQASRLAAHHALALVTGGPGTGKTYSLTRTLALLLQTTRRADGAPLHIALAAPTGKAAVRMKEAIDQNLAEIAADPDVLPGEVRATLQQLAATTLHGLLGIRPDGTVRHGPEAPLPFDVVVVDEVSMVDLVLMQRLLAALPPAARLVLLGDPDQLASVEAGTVLSDIVCAARAPASPLHGRLVTFTESRRFARAPAVGAIASALQRAGNEGVDVALGWLRGQQQATPSATVAEAACAVRRLDAEGDAVEAPDPTARAAANERLYRALFEPYAECLYAPLAAYLSHDRAALSEPATQRALLAATLRFRVLATHRRGPRGVAGLVTALEARARRLLRGQEELEQGKASSAEPPRSRPRAGDNWLGRLVLVTRNDPATELANGDVGLILPVMVQGKPVLHAVFAVDAEGLRRVPLEQLPPHEGALAMTVHKSQGSEFDTVALVLHGRDSAIQTRELVYTGVTRAKSALWWSGDDKVLAEALRRRVQRASGLVPLLRGGDADG